MHKPPSLIIVRSWLINIEDCLDSRELILKSTSCCCCKLMTISCIVFSDPTHPLVMNVLIFISFSFIDAKVESLTHCIVLNVNTETYQ